MVILRKGCKSVLFRRNLQKFGMAKKSSWWMYIPSTLLEEMSSYRKSCQPNSWSIFYIKKTQPNTNRLTHPMSLLFKTEPTKIRVTETASQQPSPIEKPMPWAKTGTLEGDPKYKFTEYSSTASRAAWHGEFQDGFAHSDRFSQGDMDHFLRVLPTKTHHFWANS